MSLKGTYETFIYKSRYARWIPEKNRRETWEETVTRYCDFWKDKYADVFPYQEIWNAIYNLDVVPSMRALMTAGPALDRDNISGFNCSYLPITDQRCFDEVMFILMNGTGVGYSVESKYVEKLPSVAEEFVDSETTIVVPDSKEGWASSFRELISLLYSGKSPKWDLSKLRPAGARLKTFGGRSSGPAPLDELFVFTCELFKKARGRKLTTVEASDLVCKTASVVVVGGVRRSALICLSDLNDEGMRHYKSGQWWVDFPHRALANISATYKTRPDSGTFLREWAALYDSKSGERGVFNRLSAEKQTKNSGRREVSQEFGTNPCGEIILRPFGYCNLSEVIVRSTDTFDDLQRKVKLATIIGTFQSTLTNYKYIRKQWKTNAEEERLLGVSMTGIMDHSVLNGTQKTIQVGDYVTTLPVLLNELKQHTITTNKEWAGKLGIEQSAAITTVKPSGTVSQLVDSASGIHPRHNPFYVRTVRADHKDPLALFLKEKGVPCEEDKMNKSNLVFSFPMKAPDGAITRSVRSAIEQLEHYLIFKKYWCEHNPSITVYVKENEWLEVGAWVYNNMDDVGGVSFLPHSEHIYPQAPYQDITEEKYKELLEAFPKFSWDDFDKYETEDTTTGAQDLACVGGSCEIP